MVRTGNAEVFIARRVARLSRHLPLDRVGVVDTAVARIIAHEAGGRVLAVAEATIIEADDDRPSRATAVPADLLGALSSADLSPLPPKAVLYIHFHESALRGTDAVARVGGLGPMSVSALAELLGRTRLTVRPVRDLSSRVRSIAYEHPESLKEQTYLVTGGDYWPYATSTSRRVRPAPTTPAPSAVDITGGRPTPAIGHASAGRVATSG